MLKAKTDMKCELWDKEGTKLCSFRATAVTDLTVSAGFEGGGVASASQAFAVFTDYAYEYKPYAQRVHVPDLDRTFILTNSTVSLRRKLGAGNKFKKVYLLELN